MDRIIKDFQQAREKKRDLRRKSKTRTWSQKNSGLIELALVGVTVILVILAVMHYTYYAAQQ